MLDNIGDKSETLVHRPSPIVIKLDSNVEMLENDDLSLLSYWPSMVLVKLESDEQVEDKIQLNDIEEKTQDNAKLLQKD